MTEDRIDRVVKRIKEIAETDYSEYAGFHFSAEPGMGYKHCFIVNDQKTFSSNFTLELEDLKDALTIISKFTGQTPGEALEDMENNGLYTKTPPLYLHYMKLLNKCQ